MYIFNFYYVILTLHNIFSIINNIYNNIQNAGNHYIAIRVLERDLL